MVSRRKVAAGGRAAASQPNAVLLLLVAAPPEPALALGPPPLASDPLPPAVPELPLGCVEHAPLKLTTASNRARLAIVNVRASG